MLSCIHMNDKEFSEIIERIKKNLRSHNVEYFRTHTIKSSPAKRARRDAAFKKISESWRLKFKGSAVAWQRKIRSVG